MVRKHLIGLFLNGGTSEKPDWVRVKKATQLTLAMNPETEDYDYIADEVPTTELKRYKPSIDEDLTMYKGEKDYEMIWPYFYEMRTGSDAHVECMVVFMQETGGRWRLFGMEDGCRAFRAGSQRRRQQAGLPGTVRRRSGKGNRNKIRRCYFFR